MRPEQRMIEIGQDIANAERGCPTLESFIDWLRGGYFAGRLGMDGLRAELDELRALFLANVSRSLTVREAQLCYVCRVCRKKAAAPFRLNYGQEFACDGCVPKEPSP